MNYQEWKSKRIQARKAAGRPAEDITEKDYYYDYVVKPKNEVIIETKSGCFRWNKINNKLYDIDRKYVIVGMMKFDDEKEKMWEVFLYP